MISRSGEDTEQASIGSDHQCPTCCCFVKLTAGGVDSARWRRRPSWSQNLTVHVQTPAEYTI